MNKIPIFFLTFLSVSCVLTVAHGYILNVQNVRISNKISSGATGFTFSKVVNRGRLVAETGYCLRIVASTISSSRFCLASIANLSSASQFSSLEGNTIAWEKKFQELLMFRDEHGHCNVPRNYGGLGNWVQKQRLAYKIRTQVAMEQTNERSMKQRKAASLSPSYTKELAPLTDKQYDLLAEVDFIWDVHEWKFNKKLDKLKKFKSQYGHIDVPSTYPEHRVLYKWLCRQKKEYKSYLSGDEDCKLTNQRRVSLERLGFYIGMFDGFDEKSRTNASTTSNEKLILKSRASWNERLEELKRYKDRYGHCHVPAKHVYYQKLGGWVQHQRSEKKKKDRGELSRMTNEKEELLNEIDFVWDLKESQWGTMFEQLKEYKKIHGNCNVPAKTGELSNWVTTQRVQHGLKQIGKHHSLSDERLEALNDLGFIWDMHELAWQEQFHKLELYYSKVGKGNLNGEVNHLDASLLAWIARQRSEKKYKTVGLHTHLTDERERKLQNIGFDWKFYEQDANNANNCMESDASF